eukprot:CAMPEP_0174710156 /NCGR_PEP_ID=MMETSP1094-20130205/11871_1 /TAXON_ID=156173 /ORGANISM="Chrysochromulina brevifilum, Strain UTEX LB 985" /LENGTH=196 /DNA_ID=CAMNT_0015908919 /DNA_START=53 /DNA_END=643 /DNA_ORIENTATION=+
MPSVLNRQLTSVLQEHAHPHPHLQPAGTSSLLQPALEAPRLGSIAGVALSLEHASKELRILAENTDLHPMTDLVANASGTVQPTLIVPKLDSVAGVLLSLEHTNKDLSILAGDTNAQSPPPSDVLYVDFGIGPAALIGIVFAGALALGFVLIICIYGVPTWPSWEPTVNERKEQGLSREAKCGHHKGEQVIAGEST